MEQQLSKTCETFVKNRDELREILKSYGAPMHLMGAAVLTALNEKPNAEKILAAEQLLKEREPEDSPIRGAIKSVTTVHMQLADDLEGYYKDLKRTHDLIYINRGADEERFYMAAMMMSDRISNMQEILLLVDRAGQIHEGLGKSFLSQEDRSSFVTACFAVTNGVVNIHAYLSEVRACLSLLEESGLFEDVPEDLGMLMAIAPFPAEMKCEKVIKILEAIRAKGIAFDSHEEAAMLAFLACLEMSPEEVADAVCDADAFAKIHSGFNDGEGIVLRRVYVSMLVTLAYASEGVWEKLKRRIEEDAEVLKRMILMQSQSVMHIQMDYVNRDDLHI